MYCPYCGAKIELSNQKFCINCGNEMPIISKTPQLETEKPLYSSQMPVVKSGGYSGPYSKKCLGYGIGSIAAAIASFLSTGPIILFRFLLVGMIIVLVVHILGLILGFKSKTNSKKAGMSEPENAVEKIGSVFAIGGIIINIIGIGLATLGLVIVLIILIY